VVEAQQLGHVTSEARQVLDHDHVERPRRREGGRQELLISRAMLDPEPGERGVLKRRDDRPALPLRIGAAELQLVLDRGR
jgi:hypothetical protein